MILLEVMVQPITTPTPINLDAFREELGQIALVQPAAVFLKVEIPLEFQLSLEHLTPST